MGKNDFFGVPKYFGKSSSYQIWEELVCVLTDMLSLEKNKWFKKKIDMEPPYISFYSFKQ